jgi:hypothetical protein
MEGEGRREGEEEEDGESPLHLRRGKLSLYWCLMVF